MGARATWRTCALGALALALALVAPAAPAQNDRPGFVGRQIETDIERFFALEQSGCLVQPLGASAHPAPIVRRLGDVERRLSVVRQIEEPIGECEGRFDECGIDAMIVEQDEAAPATGPSPVGDEARAIRAIGKSPPVQ